MIPISKREDKANSLSFAELCQVLNKVSEESKSERKVSLIFSQDLKKLLDGESPFPIVRLILPQLDAERHLYGMKHTTIAEFYRKTLGLAKDSIDALRLTNWKDPTRHMQARGGNTVVVSSVVGDLPSIIEDVLARRIPGGYSTKTIGEVNEILDQLSKADDNAIRQTLLSRIKDTFNAEEQKWLMRIVFKDLKIGVKHERVLGYLHPAAVEMYNHWVDLRRVCEDLVASAGPGYFPEASESADIGAIRNVANDGDNESVARPAAVVDVTTSQFHLFRPFMPMLAYGLNDQLDTIEPTMKGLPFVMEIKLDGERMLCHKDGDRIQWFSRKATDYTQIYGKVMNHIISRYVIAEKCILDGEMMAWDDEAKKHVGFGHNKTVAMEEDAWMEVRTEGAFVPSSSSSSSSSKDRADDTTENRGPKRWLKFIVFDIVYLDGTGADRLIRNCASSSQFSVAADAIHSGSIHNLPLDVRKSILAQVIPSPVPQRLEFVKSKTVGVCRPISSSSSSSSGLDVDRPYRAEELLTFFDEAIMAREEGLVVKTLNSQYIPGEHGRRTRQWVKMKPEYSDQTTNLDLIVLGAYYGEGKRRSGDISHFLLGIKEEPVNGEALKFTTFCKVGSGYTIEQLTTIRKHLRPHLSQWPTSGQPPHFTPWRIGKTSDIPDVWVNPEHSLVFEIKCAEIVVSDQFASGITARFPRVHEIRYDKMWHECLTSSSIRSLFDRDRTTRTSKEDHLGATSARMTKPSSQMAGLTQTNKKERKKRVSNSESSDSSSRIVLSGQHRLIAPQFRTIETSKVIVISAMFHGLIFCVYDGDFVFSQVSATEDENESDDNGAFVEGNDDEPLQRKRSFKASCSPRIKRKLAAVERKRFTKHQIEEMIVSHGGQIVASPHDTTWACIAPSSETVRVNNIIKTEKFDVLKFSWIVECVQNSNAVPLTFSHFKYITDATREDMRKSLDRFGDHFTMHCSVDSLKRSFDEANRIRDEADPRRLESGDYNALVDKMIEEKEDEFDATNFLTRFNNDLLSARRITRSSSRKSEKRIMSSQVCDTALKILATSSAASEESYVTFLTCPMSEMPCWPDMLNNSLVEPTGNYVLCPESIRECMDTRWTFFWRSNTCVYVDRYFDCGRLQDKSEQPIDDSETFELFLKNVDGRSILYSSLNPDAAQILLHGGKLASVLHDKVTHVLVDPATDMSRFSLIRSRIAELRYRENCIEKRIVNSRWIQECIDSKTVVPADDHQFQVDIR